WGRLISIFASVIAGFFLYLIVSKHSNKIVGLFSVFFYQFIPFNIYYGRTILTDSSMVMAYLGGIYFFDKWLFSSSSEVIIKSRSHSKFPVKSSTSVGHHKGTNFF